MRSAACCTVTCASAGMCTHDWPLLSACSTLESSFHPLPSCSCYMHCTCTKGAQFRSCVAQKWGLTISRGLWCLWSFWLLLSLQVLSWQHMAHSDDFGIMSIFTKCLSKQYSGFGFAFQDHVVVQYSWSLGAVAIGKFSRVNTYVSFRQARTGDVANCRNWSQPHV